MLLITVGTSSTLSRSAFGSSLAVLQIVHSNCVATLFSKHYMGNTSALHSSYGINSGLCLTNLDRPVYKEKKSGAINIYFPPIIQSVGRFSPDKSQWTRNYPGPTHNDQAFGGWTIFQTQNNCVPNPEICWLPIRAHCCHRRGGICIAFWSIICAGQDCACVYACTCPGTCTHPQVPSHSEKKKSISCHLPCAAEICWNKMCSATA